MKITIQCPAEESVKKHAKATSVQSESEDEDSLPSASVQPHAAHRAELTVKMTVNMKIPRGTLPNAYK
jgi:hypothetical protein